jgi:hypothetical protein
MTLGNFQRARTGGVYREARSGEAAAGTKRNQLGEGGKPRAGLCLRRSVGLPRCSDGAGLAGFVASAVTERLRWRLKTQR